ncbi:YslB family protein [Brevibacillus brevis]|uniref:DUF2507 domain-containing protein n=1 Tax=Brevibacillus brevis (strain 47 / JCM 6285 / NBRC 100599) TaxID=358681 RepID=C0Z9I9_BREBN|nr:YslB family protein [Brevibacillus brevis]WJQ83284.1 YslB family protein [Brevibacillus brevis]BAH42659.1 conserved hypothetical protein [Brevibacillus brevis NBRC 100599]
MKEKDQLAALLPPETIPYAERMNMPYLGYHLLRETLTSTLLGDSENHILYWIGKNMGRQIPIQSATGPIMPFIRLGLGQLDVLEENEQTIVYSLNHSIFSYQSIERLGCSLSFEAGIIAGMIEQWKEKEAFSKIEMESPSDIRISVQVAS